MLELTASHRPPTKKFTFILLLAALVSAIFSLLFLDQPLSAYFQNDLEPYMSVRKVARELTDLGYGAKYFIAGFLMMVASRVLQRFFHKKSPAVKALFHWGAKLLFSLITSGMVIHLLKFSIGRARPHKTPDFDPLVFQFWNFDPHFHSMPSGHSQTIFVAVGISLLFLSKTRWKKFSFLVLFFGCLLAFTRVVTHQHFLSDCIMGATLGYLITLYSCWLYDRRIGRDLQLQ